MGVRQSVQDSASRTRAQSSAGGEGTSSNAHSTNTHGHDYVLSAAAQRRLSARQSRSVSMPSAAARRLSHATSALDREQDSHEPAHDPDDTDDSSGDERQVNRIFQALSFDRLLRVPPSHSIGPSTSSQDNTPPTNLFLSAAGRRQIPLFHFFDIKCPVCNKTVPSDEAEMHLVLCYTRPRLTYNEDCLTEDKGECVICLEDLLSGENIARLPCLCIYHKQCIDDWFKVRNTCPEHPGDDD